jgi:hypothetical protein
VALHKMGAGQFIVLVATVVRCDIEIPVPEPIYPLVIGYLSFGCFRQITQNFLTAHTRELAEDGHGAVTFAFLPKRLKVVHVFLETAATE